jgi:hypothetical protein
VGSLRHLSESGDERVSLGSKPSLKSQRRETELGASRHASSFQHHVHACITQVYSKSCAETNIFDRRGDPKLIFSCHVDSERLRTSHPGQLPTARGGPLLEPPMKSDGVEVPVEIL